MNYRRSERITWVCLIGIPMGVALFVLRDRPLLVRLGAAVACQAAGFVVVILLRPYREPPP